MIKNNIKKLFFFLTILTVGISFIGGDCGTESEDPPPPSTVAAPTNVDLKVDANPGGGSFAIVSWTHSTDQGIPEFSHYRVITYQVDENGSAVSVFNDPIDVPKTSSTQIINSISRSTRYRSFVQSFLTNGVKSDSVPTKIYGGVYFNTGNIDEFASNSSAESGYGWASFSGLGTSYSYSSQNFDNIDLHLRADNTGNLVFYSPDAQGATRHTLIGLIGGGQTSFDKTELAEPNQTSQTVAEDIVYLIKTQDDIYIKIWVKTIEEVDSNPSYQSVTFDYKLQPIEGLRVLKN